jgi:hypothetical protein
MAEELIEALVRLKEMVVGSIEGHVSLKEMVEGLIEGRI